MVGRKQQANEECASSGPCCTLETENLGAPAREEFWGNSNLLLMMNVVAMDLGAF
jgi:hypothetical protein